LDEDSIKKKGGFEGNGGGDENAHILGAVSRGVIRGAVMSDTKRKRWDRPR
jgi:hypothetical protein